MTTEFRRAAGAAQAALDQGDWAAARAGFERAAGIEATPEVLEGLGQALFCEGQYGAAIEKRERAFVLFRARGDEARAAKLAAWLGVEHGAIYGNESAMNGWLARATRLVESAGDCPERGWVELGRAVASAVAGERDEHLLTAVEIARRYGDNDLEFEALAVRGAFLVDLGRLEEGMALLDESLAAAAAGEVKDFVAVSDMYCYMLQACELANDVRRAEQWLGLAERFAQRTTFVPVSASCRAYYGSILMAAGRWAEAEQEFATSIDQSPRPYAALRSAALVRLADLRIRQGQLEEAARLLTDADQDPYAVRTFVELYLARGEADLAVGRAARFLRESNDNDLAAPVLLLLVRGELARKNTDAAGDAARQLEQVAEGSRNRLVHALSRYAAGLVAAATEQTGAIAHLEAAVVAFQRLALPLEEGRARLALGELLVVDQPAVAVTEARAALELFRSLPAPRDADAAAGLLRRLGFRGHAGGRSSGMLTRREQEVLDLVGAGLSNDQIATRLYIGRRTVEHHVSNLLAKLGLLNRAEAAAYVSRQSASGASARE